MGLWPIMVPHLMYAMCQFKGSCWAGSSRSIVPDTSRSACAVVHWFR